MSRPATSAALATLLGGALLFLGACASSGPGGASQSAAPPNARSAGASSGMRLPVPGCIARPRLRNEEDVRELLASLYPESLRSRGVTGTADVWMEIANDGSVQRSALAKSSGYAAIDEAAVQAAALLEFEPGALDACPGPSWVSIPITLAPTSG